jgi:hypothetical protein
MLEWQSQSLWIFWSNVCLLLLDKCCYRESGLHLLVCVESTSSCTAKQPLHHYHRFHREPNVYLHVFGKCSWPHLRHRLTKKLQQEGGGASVGCTHRPLEMKAWCHMLVYMVNYHCKHNCVSLLYREGGSHKRQVVIHIFHSLLHFPLKESLA